MLGGKPLVAFGPTKDPKQARRFYQGTLGLGFVSQDSFAFVVDANGTWVRVANVPDFKPAQLQF